MKKTAQYIKRIEIDSLWSGRRHVAWDLRPDVNILSGVNGVGKSTILNRIVAYLLGLDRTQTELQGVHLDYFPEDSGTVRFDVIRSFDRPVISSDMLSQLADIHLRSELDLQLYQLQRRYLDYQVNLSNRIVEVFTRQAPDAQQRAAVIAQEKTRFQDIIDSLFRETGKVINRQSNELQFVQMGETVGPYQLSSGEKQMLIILLTVLVQNHEPCVLFMDEPEVSLHIEWQQRLIGLVRELNANAQIILTTHSPAVIMDGWGDCVTDVEDIVS
ncbi:MAG: AAA family ATPase [Bacteroidaceae bacterium]|nr:AAA family ATPase [Bacteroidaceae bacterium]